MFEQPHFSIDGLPVLPAGDGAPPSADEPTAHPDAELHAREWADCSGAVLAKLIADVMSSVPHIPDNPDGDARIFDLVTATVRVEAWATAVRARLIATVHARALAEHRAHGLVRGLVQGDGDGDHAGSDAGASHGFDDDEYTRREIAANLSLELGVTLPVAEREVRLALGLVRAESGPPSSSAGQAVSVVQTLSLAQALSDGRVDAAQSRAIVEELEHIPSAEVREPVIESLLTQPESPRASACLVRELRPGRRRLWELPPTQLRAIIRREAQRREPELATERLAAVRAERHVRYHPGRDAMAEVVLRGPAESMTAVYSHLTLTAHAAKRTGTRGTLDQLRHDIGVGWLTEGAHGLQVVHREVTGRSKEQLVLPRTMSRTMINVTVADTTLLGLDQLPAELHSPSGPVAIPAELARQLAHDPEQATWRRILCDPATGIATDVSPAYRPPVRMVEFVKVRDGFRSRFPTSNATSLELDHLLRYDHGDPAAGGRTTSSNLASAGRWDHHLKTDGAFTVEGDANARLTFRGRADRPHASLPHQYRDPLDPGRPPQDGDPPF